MPELNEFGNRLQATVEQTAKQRRYIRTRIFLCQNVCLLIGVSVALLVAILWRYQHRLVILSYVCPRDPTRAFCSSSI